MSFPRVAWVSALALSVSFAFAAGGCSGGCSYFTAELPQGMPPKQVIEGGLQARITKSGFDKISAALPQMIEDALKDQLCIPRPWDYDLGGIATLAVCDYCFPGTKDQKPGCPIVLNLDSVTLEAKDPILNVNVALHGEATFGAYILGLPIIGDVSICDFTVTVGEGSKLSAGISFDINPQTGYLRVHFASFGGIDLKIRFDIGGLCTWIPEIQVVVNYINTGLDYVFGFLRNEIVTQVVNLLAPIIDQFIQQLVPVTPGVEGVLDVGAMLKNTLPGVTGKLELRAIAGGYVNLRNNGLSLGVVTGVNSDRDTATRTPEALASEPARCVPARPPIDLSKRSPDPLDVSQRQTLKLGPAGVFSGLQEPADTDVLLGISRAMLQVAGFHVYNSGVLCARLGTNSSPTLQMLNAGILSAMVNSLGDLIDDAKAPVLLQLRPQRPIDFEIGDPAQNQAALTMVISDLQIDFNVWINERYTRIFTLGIDMKIGIDLTSATTPDGKPAVQPTIKGLDSASVRVKVMNAELLSENIADLEQSLPRLMDVIAATLGGGLPPIVLPELSGFAIDKISTAKVTAADEFLALLLKIKTTPPSPFQPLMRARRVETTARVLFVQAPTFEDWRDLMRDPKAGPTDLRYPRVMLELGGSVEGGGALEWQYRVDGAMWHNYFSQPRPVIADPAFLLPGRHVIEVRARAVDDFRALDQTPARLEVEVGEQPPLLRRPRSRSAAPAGAAAGLPGAEVAAATLDGPPAAPQAGCSLAPARHAGGGQLAATLLVLCVVPAGHLLRRRARRGWLRRLLPLFGLCALSLGLVFFVSGCGCDTAPEIPTDGGTPPLTDGGVPPRTDGTPPPQCTKDVDCKSMSCPAGQVGACKSGKCTCINDVVWGDIGRFSAVAVANNADLCGSIQPPCAIVSAYNDTHGDLMVGRVKAPGVVAEWEFVDGVPSGNPDITNGKVRGGISTAGDDVGRYTDIAVSGDNVYIVYFDNTHGSLKLARREAGAWVIGVVDQGTGGIDPGSGNLGRYNMLSLSKDGIPSVAYYAETPDASGGIRSQLRYAWAKSKAPLQAGDWTKLVVDEATIPAGAPNPSPDLPWGTGLFPSLTRLSNDLPIIAYYDHIKGNLMLAQWDTGVGSAFGVPMVIDGVAADGKDSGDVGQYVSVVADENDDLHLVYLDATLQVLRYQLFKSVDDHPVEIIDDGFRIDGKNQDGYDMPVPHLVGANANLLLSGTTLLAFYQDQTAHLIDLSLKEAGKAWSTPPEVIAGNEPSFVGAFGFYIHLWVDGGTAFISSLGINAKAQTATRFVQVFTKDLGIIE